MKAQLQDAYRALGWSVMFAAYAAYLGWDVWYRRRKARQNARSQLILDGAEQRREELIAEELMVNNGS